MTIFSHAAISCCLVIIIVSESLADGVWFGTAPFCNGLRSDCDHFDLKYVKSDRYGDGALCLTGEKVFCAIQNITPSAPNNDTNNLVVITYNLMSRPIIFYHDGQLERTFHLPRALFSRFANVDVIVFQEVFISLCLNEISFTKLLQLYGFHYTTPIVGQNSKIAILNGGVFIASRWPIESQSEHIFQHFTQFSSDALASKGVAYAKLNKLGQIYHVFGTHMQPYFSERHDETRILQAREIRLFVNRMLGPIKNSQAARVIVAGDFNTDLINYPRQTHQVAASMDVVYLPIANDSLNCTFCRGSNYFAYTTVWVDFVAISKSFAQPKSMEMKSFQLTSDKSFNICARAFQPFYVFPHSINCFRTISMKDLSDHFPIIGTLNF